MVQTPFSRAENRVKKEPIRWLTRGALIDEGAHTAVYPYIKLRNILTKEDCRKAALEETQPFENEFGRDAVQPFYDLLWELNNRAGVFTSHCGASGPEFRPYPKEWACGIGTHIIFLPRKYKEQNSLQACEGIVDNLGRTLASSSSARESSAIGRWIQISAVHVNYYCEEFDAGSGILREVSTLRRGFGCQLLLAGAGATRPEAATRWGETCSFIGEVLAPVKAAPPAEPFDHSLHFRLI